MIDIVFLLIIFFVVTASFDREQLDSEVTLPAVDASAAKTFPARRIMLNILADGTVRAGFESFSIARLDSELTPFLRSRREDGGEAVVIINADRDMPHRHLAAVLESVGAAGFHRVRINAEVRKEAGP